MIFCSQAIPARRGPTDPVLLRELALDVPLRFAGEIQEAGIDRLLVVQHLPFAENGDPREGDPLWRTMLDAEQELRNRLDRDAVRFILLPSLWGPGQSPRTAPLRQLWQIASRLPVEIPADDSPVLLAPLDAAANAVVSRAVAGDPPPERVFAPLLQSMSVTVHDLLEHFAEVAGIDPGELQGTLPPWGPPGETGPWDKERVNAHMAMLLEQAKHMPHFPPFDWAGELKREEKKQRSIRRKKRKARRENREDR